MINRFTLLATVALVVPAATALGQSPAPGGNAPRPGAEAASSAAARHNSRPAAASPATEDMQGNAQTAEAPDASGTPPAPANGPASPPAAPAAEASGSAPPHAAVRAAIAADLRAGARVVDTAGAVVGTVESADATGAIVSTGAVRARVPLVSFASNGSGLVISMNRAQFEAAARSAAAAHPTSG